MTFRQRPLPEPPYTCSTMSLCPKEGRSPSAEWREPQVTTPILSAIMADGQWHPPKVSGFPSMVNSLTKPVMQGSSNVDHDSLVNTVTNIQGTVETFSDTTDINVAFAKAVRDDLSVRHALCALDTKSNLHTIFVNNSIRDIYDYP